MNNSVSIFFIYQYIQLVSCLMYYFIAPVLESWNNLASEQTLTSDWLHAL